MADKRPTVSVVMATYNGEKYIREQIDSILNQSYPIYELIIQDDCSTDSTPDICREYESQHPNIHFFENEHNLGFNDNFQTASMRATGDFVALSDQDDFWFPEKIEKQVAAIGDHDICTSYHTRGKQIDQSKLIRIQYSFESLLFNAFAGHTMLLRRDFIQDEKNWIPYLYYDWSLALSAQLNKGIVCVKQPLNWHRSNENSAGAGIRKKYLGKEKSHSAFTPYLHGLHNYRKIQTYPVWKPLYQYLYKETENKQDLQRVHKMIGYMLKTDILSLAKLCWICMKDREIIYPEKPKEGIMGAVRGFFYPFIFAYNNYQYKGKK